jgi:hypothetical protein
MKDDEATALLREPCELQKEQLELLRTYIAKQQQAIATQAATIDRQEGHRKVLDRSRKWTLILLGAVLALFIVYFLQPLLVIWFTRGR